MVFRTWKRTEAERSLGNRALWIFPRLGIGKVTGSWLDRQASVKSMLRIVIRPAIEASRSLLASTKGLVIENIANARTAMISPVRICVALPGYSYRN